jgi:hypothetical protein
VDRLSKIGSTKHEIPAGVSLEIIRKPSIKLSPESGSIYVPEDQAPAPLPNLGAAISELKGTAGQPSAAGSAKDSGAVVSKLAPHSWPTRQSRHVDRPGCRWISYRKTTGYHATDPKI